MLKTEHKAVGLGSLALLLALMGIAWGITLHGVCLGDYVLNLVGLRTWSIGNPTTHVTVFYSLIFFALSFVFGITHKDDYGSLVGRALSLSFGVFILFAFLMMIIF